MKNNMKYFLTLLMIYAAVIGYAQTDTTQSTADKIIEGNKVKIILKDLIVLFKLKIKLIPEQYLKTKNII